MEIDCSDNSNWLLDYGIGEAIPLAWPLHSPDFNSVGSNTTSMVLEDLDGHKEEVCRKREDFLEICLVLAEKNELREEKQRLKSEKETLELKMKAKNAQPGFLTHSPAMPAMFASQAQAAGNKLMPFVGYPSVAMWQFMQPAVVDTSQDHILRPPVA
ncbi:hypothetical protein ACFE04_030569 [Oxalis oulophora]